ncbi:hypothetical protein J4N45_11145 [Vibrio sp. SCSIO 43140]|uniref:hypothetical protein n=1 Tax=Vibrio sp. SCSIO 43140 TaxID=2819100 RepID=UPI002076030D|nr:hypothetical protein [Vibrio sp. SCSIO 43140]USD59087.1 hypothetical protein J4N45_11145 [Vibrio sp. SCSIO 43140]
MASSLVETRFKDKAWNFANNTFLSTLSFIVVGALLSIALYKISTGVAYVAAYSVLIIAYWWTLLGLLANQITRNTCSALALTLILNFGFDSLVHTFFEPVTLTQHENVQTSVAGGLFTDTYYLHLPELVKVNRQATKIRSPYIIQARTSDGLFEKVFICRTKQIDSNCGMQL